MTENKTDKSYEKSRQFNNLDQPAYDYGLSRESWCKVEKSNNEQHTRKFKKHFLDHNNSRVFESSSNKNSSLEPDSSRIDGLLQNQIGDHAEKRHYPNKQNSSYFSLYNPKS